LGVRLDLVKLEKYSPDWFNSFLKEKYYLSEHFKVCNPCIEHIGSTSIRIDAKPIVDIVIGISSLELVSKVDFKILSQNNWFRIKRTFKDEVVMAKYTDSGYKTKSHYAHIVKTNSNRWREMVVFRDKLLANESLRCEYLALKQRLAIEYADDVDRYTDAKKQFVLSVVAQ
jgi:GrpB-like predicted nucleotidyltransferase (UPF0157 family)